MSTPPQNLHDMLARVPAHTLTTVRVSDLIYFLTLLNRQQEQSARQLDSLRSGSGRRDERWQLAASAASLQSPAAPLRTQPAKPVRHDSHFASFLCGLSKTQPS